jgi:hypothetical protein
MWRWNSDPSSLPCLGQGAAVRRGERDAIGPLSYGRVGGVQLPDLRDWRACYRGFREPVAHLRGALLGTWTDVETWALAAGGFK